jgi:hypothetical protein
VPGLGFAGFVGLSAKVPFELPVPGIVTAPHAIGWRLTRAAWGHGFEVARLPQIVSFAALDNRRRSR